jgi:protein SCO1
MGRAGPGRYNTPPMNNRLILKILIILVAIAALGAGVGSHLAMQAKREATPPAGMLWPDPRPVPVISLTDHTGAQFGRANLEGHWSLLFFGFTHCPDICPMTLSQLNEMEHRLAASGGRTDDLQTIFVSVDPDRDNPQRLAEYVGYFNEDFIGVSGEPDELQKLTRGLGAVYFIEDKDTDNDYLVDHSASVFVIDPDGRLIGIFTTPHEPVDMATRLQAIRRFMEQQA